ncbi:MAG: HD domain-containing protein [Candidatus Eremiobacteraeota bacterium]|nr:HD domain-containing protein [Candidatus Eremiobacteraeota bacterium]
MKRVFDPVHHFIELTDTEARLLDSPVMQRLRRLRQLGLAYLAYPSAEHSRFTHALGALAAGTRVFDSLMRHSGEFFSGEADVAAQRRLVRAALLLHDIGHGPFSHACEEVLGVRHETRTEALIALPEIRTHLDALDVDAADVLALITGSAREKYPVLSEMVSGPNLDADRMDYLLRDAYFTGVASGRYDADQLISSTRIFNIGGRTVMGIDRRGVVALESFVLARYMMFASVCFHHTTRIFERILQDVLRELWPDPHRLDPIDEFLRWDDFRVLNDLRDSPSAAARALRERIRVYGVAAEFNAERDLEAFDACRRALVETWGEAAVWTDEQSQLLHRLPLQAESGPTVWVSTSSGEVVDAREASDVIAKLSGKAYWRKLFVERSRVDLAQARRLCRDIARRSFSSSS